MQLYSWQEKNPGYFNTYAILYACIYIYMLWSYYLVQVWGFWSLLSGPSLFIVQHCLSIKHYRIGVSAHFLKTKKNICMRRS